MPDDAVGAGWSVLAESVLGEFFLVASDAHKDFTIASSGLPEVLESWQGPGGYVVMSRWKSVDHGDLVAIGITPTGGGSHGLVFALAEG